MLSRIGITERGDAALDLSWIKKLQPANIIISKGFNPSFNSALIKHSDSIIYHCTCTGYGGSILEPHVPSSEKMFENIYTLIKNGFPPSHIVLRCDPIIPTPKGLITFENLLKLFLPLPIKRVRYSFLDMYPHVIRRFYQHNIPLPYSSFHAPSSFIKSADNIFKKFTHLEFEACAENTPHKLGCISQKDLAILNKDIILTGSCNQRKQCLCPSNKYELLSYKKEQCKHGCIYCFWK